MAPSNNSHRQPKSFAPALQKNFRNYLEENKIAMVILNVKQCLIFPWPHPDTVISSQHETKTEVSVYNTLR